MTYCIYWQAGERRPPLVSPSQRAFAFLIPLLLPTSGRRSLPRLKPIGLHMITGKNAEAVFNVSMHTGRLG